MVKPWKKLASRITFTDPWMTLRTDTVELNNGNIIENYHVIDAKDWVNIIALTDDGMMVTIHEYRHGIEEVTLGVPGGCIDPEDESPLVAAHRELEEESGYTCRELVQTGHSSANWADHSNQIYFFLGFGAEPNGRMNLDPNEEIAVSLTPFSDFRNYDFDGPKHTHHAAALFFAERYFKRHPDRDPCK
ncbi:MAG: NUDIX hydrolase [Pseudomonadota bacterium]